MPDLKTFVCSIALALTLPATAAGQESSLVPLPANFQWTYLLSDGRAVGLGKQVSLFSGIEGGRFPGPVVVVSGLPGPGSSRKIALWRQGSDPIEIPACVDGSEFAMSARPRGAGAPLRRPEVVNALGQVLLNVIVKAASTAPGVARGPRSSTEAFVWDAISGRHPLPVIPEAGFTQSIASCISDRGAVVDHALAISESGDIPVHVARQGNNPDYFAVLRPR